MNVSETKSKTAISFFLAIAISCAFFLIIMFSLPDSLYTMYENFFSQTLSEKDKIFILGSSHVYSINPIIISDYLKENNYEFEVYNLSGPGDDFEERERAIDMIINQQPKILVYGIEPRAFESAGRSTTQLPDNPLPNLGSITELFNMVDLGDKKGIIKNPKFAVIRTISNPVQEKNIENHPYPNSPFLTYNPDMTKITDQNGLYDIRPEYVAKIHPVEKNSGLHALYNIINKLEKNNIKVVLFVTPHSEFYLEAYPENQAKIFQEILDDISEKHGIMIHSLYDNYAELNVWHDHTHLAANDNTNFYSKDVAVFIINELER